jgi:hypothetical protein
MRRHPLAYGEMNSVDAGLRFKSPSGSIVETTGTSLHIAAHDLHVHEVVIAEGTGKGYKYLLNLDTSEAQ